MSVIFCYPKLICNICTYLASAALRSCLFFMCCKLHCLFILNNTGHSAIDQDLVIFISIYESFIKTERLLASNQPHNLSVISLSSELVFDSAGLQWLTRHHLLEGKSGTNPSKYLGFYLFIFIFFKYYLTLVSFVKIGLFSNPKILFWYKIIICFLRAPLLTACFDCTLYW